METFKVMHGNFWNPPYNTYFPVLKFTTADGAEYTFTSEYYSLYFDQYREGNSIKIKYNKNNPREAEIANRKFYNFSWRIALFGLLLIISVPAWIKPGLSKK